MQRVITCTSARCGVKVNAADARRAFLKKAGKAAVAAPAIAILLSADVKPAAA